jgi:virginiamycin A acetyltransferase
LLRDQIRDGLTAVFILLTAPLWVTVRLVARRGRETEIFSTFGQGLSLIPSKIGSLARRAYYLMTLEDCAIDIGIGFGTWFSKRRVRISPRVSFGAHCLIGSCSIGEGTLVGSNIDILSGRHQHALEASANSRASQSSVFTQVHIGRNVWIGNRSVIMADIGDNSVIGAGSVVLNPVPTDSLAAGNPAAIKRNLSGEIGADKNLFN